MEENKNTEFAETAETEEKVSDSAEVQNEAVAENEDVKDEV